jgi:CNT family concentrative nucleoside transporter
MGVSGAESLAAAANVFMGQTEAPIIIAPYIPKMTFSELMALMTGGMATVSGAILGGYIALGINPEYLITASVMAAPASLMMAKIIIPETEKSKTSGKVTLKVERTDANIIEAAARGASQGLTLAFNIAAMLIAFISIIYLLNGVLSWAGSLAGFEAWFGEALTFELILGYALAPLAFVMGVPFSDVTQVGQLIGLKIVLNEFLAYAELSSIQGVLQPKSQLIVTFALCGFANLSSIGIQIGGVGALAPQRKADLARLGLRALLAGSLASFSTATLAGILS